MTTLKALIQFILVLSMVILIGCGSPEAMKPAFVHPSAVFVAKAGTDTATCPVEHNYSMDDEGRPREYRGEMLLQQDAIDIHYQFVGTTFCPVSADGREWQHADVYVVAITGKNFMAETIPIVYRGEKTVVVDRPDLQVVLRKGDSEPALTADLARLGG